MKSLFLSFLVRTLKLHVIFRWFRSAPAVNTVCPFWVCDASQRMRDCGMSSAGLWLADSDGTSSEGGPVIGWWRMTRSRAARTHFLSCPHVCLMVSSDVYVNVISSCLFADNLLHSLIMCHICYPHDFIFNAFKYDECWIIPVVMNFYDVFIESLVVVFYLFLYF